LRIAAARICRLSDHQSWFGVGIAFHQRYGTVAGREPNELSTGMIFNPTLLLPAAFFFLAVLSRYIFRWTQSRFQIAAFSAAGAALPLITAQTGWSTAILCAAAATIGILLVKLALEGWSA
jgi:hypothetical protein